jgi:hypothetical protein
LAIAAILATPVLAKNYSAADDMKKAALAKANALAELSKLYQAEVKVDASKAIRTIPDELFSQNINVYDGSCNGKDLAFNAASTVMGSKFTRFPGGGYAEFTDWENYPSGETAWLPINMEDGINFAKQTGTQLQIIVNTDGVWADGPKPATGAWKNKKHTREETIEKAVKWVKHMNVSPKALYCKYWEIGNENFKDKGYEYAEKYIQFSKAMKAVDPSIKTGCQIQYDHADWTIDILKTLKKAGVTPDFWIVHTYPIWFPVPCRKASDAPTWDKKLYASNPFQDVRILDLAVSFPKEANEKLNTQIADNFDPKAVGKIPILVTEFRATMEYKYDEFVDAMFSMQYLLTVGEMGYGGTNIWAFKNGFSKETGCDFGLLRTGANADFADDNPKSSPRPTYYVFPFLSRFFGRDLVKCSYPDYAPLDSEGNKLRSWAAKDKDGNLNIMLVNNNPLSSAEVDVKIAGFPSGTEGKTWLMESVGKTLEGEDEPVLQRRDISINGVVRPDPTTLPGEGKPLTVGNTFKATLPPASMMMVRIPKGEGPVLDASAVAEAPKASVENKKPAASSALGASAEVVLQDFQTDDKGVYSPWKDEKGSVLSYVLEPVKPHGKAGEKMITIKYNHVGGGWCGLFCRAGEDWNGLNIGKPKYITFRVFSEKPVAFGLVVQDEVKNEIKVEVPMTEESPKWQTIKLPVYPNDQFRGTVKGFNIYMMVGGQEGQFSIDKITFTN